MTPTELERAARKFLDNLEIIETVAGFVFLVCIVFYGLIWLAMRVFQ